MNFFIFERIILGVCCLFFMILYTFALRKIYRDSSNLLDRLDKLIFILSFIQSILLFSLFLFSNSDFIYLLFRIFRLMQEIYILTIFSYVIFDEKHHDIIYKMIYVLMISILILFIYILIELSYCNLPIWLYISVYNLIITCLGSLFALKGIIKIYSYFKNESIDKNLDSSDDETRTDLNNLTMIQMNNRRKQLLIFLFSNLLPTLCYFFSDYYLYNENLPCNSLLQSDSLIVFLYFLFIKSIQFIFPIASIYYVFFWRVRIFFETKTNQLLDIRMDSGEE